jgi:DnaJ-class molecular chaperone
MAKKRDYYEALGVTRAVSGDEIRTAYRTPARKLHPDLNQNEKAAAERFKKIQEAEEILSNPENRKNLLPRRAAPSSDCGRYRG